MSQPPPRPRRSLYPWLIGAVAVLAVMAIVIIVIKPFGDKGAEGKVRVGYLPIAADLPLFVASEQGYFKKRGLDVDLIRFESSPLMGTAFVNNDVDAVASIATTVALSTESRDPGRFRIFMVDANTPESPLSGMLTMPGTGVKTIEDLRGKKVGIFPGSNAALVFGLVFKKHGLDPTKDLTLIELPAGSQLQALSGGQVDALCTWEPITTQAVLDYKAVNFHPAAVEREVISPYNAGVWLVGRSTSMRRLGYVVSMMSLPTVDVADHHGVEPRTLLLHRLLAETMVAEESANADQHAHARDNTRGGSSCGPGLNHCHDYARRNTCGENRGGVDEFDRSHRSLIICERGSNLGAL